MSSEEVALTQREESNGNDVITATATLQNLKLGEEDGNVLNCLDNFESPFNWLPNRFSDVSSKEVITKAMDRIETDEGFDSTFPFVKFVRLLTLVYEYSQPGQEDEQKALEQLDLCDQLIRESCAHDVSTYDKLKAALTHATQATRAHLLLRRGNTMEARQMAEAVQPLETLGDRAAAAAMKARFLQHYGGRGARLAEAAARDALHHAPDEPLWQVLTAEAVRRLRKFMPGTEQVSGEELSLLERAVGQHRSARHLVLLAQAYREHSDATFKLHRSEPDFFHSQIFKDLSDMQGKAFELYKEALALKPDSEVVNRLCGYGLLKLPAFTSDYRLAERCLKRALELAPNNPTTIHALGLYYYKGLMEYEKAALFCEKAGKLGNFPASLDMLRMKRLVYGNNYNPVFDFSKLLRQYGEDRTKRHEVLCQMGSYYLFFERNLREAVKHLQTLAEEDAEPAILANHKCTFLNMACKINLLEFIVNEGNIFLQKADVISGEEECIKNFLDKLKESHPHMFEAPINPNMVDELHKVSDDIKQTYLRKKERRDSVKEKRRNSQQRRRCSFDESMNRRHSEGGVSFRRKSSGSINDPLQSQIFMNPSQDDSKESAETNQQDSLKSDSEKSLSSQRRYEFYKSNGYHVESSGPQKTMRRRSSGAISDVLQNRNFRHFNNPHYKQHSLDGVPPQIYESINETLHETEKHSRSGKNRDFNKSIHQSGSSSDPKPQYKRYESWNSTTKSEKPQVENWRKRDDNV